MLKAGKYYVGDLCYVMGDRWDDVCTLMSERGNGSEMGTGEFTLDNNVKIGILRTECGDGLYGDGEGHDYPVDSGTIGCILISDLIYHILDDVSDITNIANGASIVFEEDFDVEDYNGVLSFGHVDIDTRGEYLEEDEDEEEGEDSNK